MVRNFIPNLFTLFNLLMGCMSLYFVFTQQYLIVFWLILFAAIADVLDGLVARLLKVSGDLGKQLDSLADVVSFGVVPGALFFQMIRYAYEANHTHQSGSFGTALAFGGFVFTLGSALRLAKFNLDTSQSTDFVGLATPGASLSVIGLMLVHHKGTGFMTAIVSNEYFLLGFALLLFFLMLSPIRMFSLKSMAQGGMNKNLIPIVFSVSAIIATVVFGGQALAILPLLYVLLSLYLYRKT